MREHTSEFWRTLFFFLGVGVNFRLFTGKWKIKLGMKIIGGSGEERILSRAGPLTEIERVSAAPASASKRGLTRRLFRLMSQLEW